MAHSDASRSSRIPILRSRLPRASSLLSGRQGNHLRMAHSLNTPPGPLSGFGIGRVQLERYTAEGRRILQDSLHTVIQELRPMMEDIRTAGNRVHSLVWLRTPQQQMQRQQQPLPLPPRSQQPPPLPSRSHQRLQNVPITQSSSGDSFVITANTAQASNSHHHHHHRQRQQNTNMAGGAAEMLRHSPGTKESLSLLQFLGILLTKGTYDHRSGILLFIGLFITFAHTNAVVKREIAKQSRRRLSSLLLIVCNLLGCILFIYYMFQDQKLYLSLVFIPPYTQPLSVWDGKVLLWIVSVTDFVLKLVTIILKVSIAALPVFLLPYQKRGKCYLFLETTSQLYRSLAPIQPWLYYLLGSYQGTAKVVGVFLSAAYMVSKGTDLVNRVKLWRGAFWKLLQNVNLGVSPNKDQLQTAGSQCPICHDEYETPVLLHCRHIFCEACIATWFDREQTCPLCRAKVVDDPSWRDGATTYFNQLY
ncbi:RING finger and transmembrane domain-containing protein 2 [Cryptotermes secundus]|uniref:RING finger and transmembrane domain-containing protein 2 n=1 Tax=Cryptotermes secundus TaxID=105785 RepID=UPI000CD7ACFB|nr:RING finger and transmembrane domain-containing protein 2 [Cryptotermes secundus]